MDYIQDRTPLGIWKSVNLRLYPIIIVRRSQLGIQKSVTLSNKLLNKLHSK